MNIFFKNLLSLLAVCLTFLIFQTSVKAEGSCQVSYVGKTKICSGSANVSYNSLITGITPATYAWDCNVFDNSSPSSTTSSSQTPNNLIGYFKFDEASGGVAFDSSGLNNNLTLNSFSNLSGRDVSSASGWTAINKKLGSGALMFNGVNNYAEVPSNPGLENFSQGLTVETWVKKSPKDNFFNKKLLDGPMNLPSFSAKIFDNKIYYLWTEISGEYTLPYYRSYTSAMKHHNIWLAVSDLDGSNWSKKKLSGELYSKTNFDFTVWNGKIYYIWTQNDGYFSIWNFIVGTTYAPGSQIWTASSNLDGSNFIATVRPTNGNYSKGYAKVNVDAGGVNYAWSGSHVLSYWSGTYFPKDIWFGRSDFDGSNWSARVVYSDNNDNYLYGFSSFAGKLYYLWSNSYQFGYETYSDSVFLAQSALDGSNWIFRNIDSGACGPSYPTCDGAYPGKLFKTNSKMFCSWRKDRVNKGFLGSWNFDGSGWSSREENKFFSPNIVKIFDQKMSVLPWVSPSSTQNTLQVSSFFPDGNDLTILTSFFPADNLDQYKPYFSDYSYVGDKAYFVGFIRDNKSSVSPNYIYLDQIFVAQQRPEIISKGNSFGMRFLNNKLRVFINHEENDPPNNSSGAILESNLSNDWNHVVMTYDKSNVKLYINGSLIATTPYNNSINVNENPLVFGSNFTGYLDTTRIYNKALTASEILSNFQKGDDIEVSPPPPAETATKDCFYDKPGFYRASLTVNSSECSPGPIIELTSQKTCQVKIKSVDEKDIDFSNDKTIYIEKEMEAKVVRDCAEGGDLVWDQPQNGRITGYPDPEKIRVIFNPAGSGSVGATLKNVPGASGDIICEPAVIRVRDKVKWGL